MVWVLEPAVCSIGCGTVIPSAFGASVPEQHLACHLLPVYCFALTQRITHALFVGPRPRSHDPRPGFIMIPVCLRCCDGAMKAADWIVVPSLDILSKIRHIFLHPPACLCLSWSWFHPGRASTKRPSVFDRLLLESRDLYVSIKRLRCIQFH